MKEQYKFYMKDKNSSFEIAEKIIKGLEENNKSIGWILENREGNVEYWITYDRKYLLKKGIGHLSGANKVVVL